MPLMCNNLLKIFIFWLFFISIKIILVKSLADEKGQANKLTAELNLVETARNQYIAQVL